MSKIPNNKVIAIAGTVGVGKSTFTNKLAQKLNYKTSFEKVDSNPYLDLYYNDFARWGFHLQIFFLAERYKDAKFMFEHGGGFIQDRTIYEDMDIFTRMNYEKGTMTQEDYSTYLNLYNAMVLSPFFNNPDLVIYLEGDFDSVIQRINERGREMEIKTDPKYWKELHRRYEEWIDNFRESRVLRININDYDVEDEDSFNLIIDKIQKILEA